MLASSRTRDLNIQPNSRRGTGVSGAKIMTTKIQTSNMVFVQLKVDSNKLI